MFAILEAAGRKWGCHSSAIWRYQVLECGVRLLRAESSIFLAPDDIYVSLSQVKRWLAGDTVEKFAPKRGSGILRRCGQIDQ